MLLPDQLVSSVSLPSSSPRYVARLSILIPRKYRSISPVALHVSFCLGWNGSQSGPNAFNLLLPAVNRWQKLLAVVERIHEQLAARVGILKTAKALGVGTGTVHRIKREMAAIAA